MQSILLAWGPDPTPLLAVGLIAARAGAAAVWLAKSDWSHITEWEIRLVRPLLIIACVAIATMGGMGLLLLMSL